MGYAGRNSETESALPAGILNRPDLERRSATVDCFRLVCCIEVQTRSREDLRQRRVSALIFLRVRTTKSEAVNPSACLTQV
jgi:hypothetical protein